MLRVALLPAPRAAAARPPAPSPSRWCTARGEAALSALLPTAVATAPCTWGPLRPLCVAWATATCNLAAEAAACGGRTRGVLAEASNQGLDWRCQNSVCS